MKIFCASIVHETNTFAPLPTGLTSFEEYGLWRGNGSREDPDGVGAFIRYVRELAEADEHEFIESICAFAQPAGRIVCSVYERLRDQLLEDLRAAMPLDVVQLFMHGAMAAEAYDDCEGDILARIRSIIGPDVALGVELDLHCHFTELMRASADAVVCFKEYPHVDGQARAAELYRILMDAAMGRTKPITAVFDCKMVGLFHTTRDPMASFVRRIQSFEGRGGILSVSLGHGFPWGDVAEGGAKLWVIADRDGAGALRLAEQLGKEFWQLRQQISLDALDLENALDRAMAVDCRPVILADVADNAGGGASSDSTFILRRLIERGVGNSVLGAFWDPGAVHICRAAGVGAVLDLRIGGKCGPTSGMPIDLRATVRAVRDNHSQRSLDGHTPFGLSVWIETNDGLHLLLTSIRNQVIGRDAFTGLGLSLEDKTLIVVKSMQHFRSDFASIAKEILYVSTPGALTSNFSAIDYRRRSPQYWPRIADPHAARVQELSSQ